MPRRSVQGLLDGHVPSLDRAADIAAALGLELTIGPPREPEPARPAAVAPAPVPPPESGPAPAPEPVADPRIAEALAALADEYEALDARGRESLLIRFWALHPDLRERERRLARVVAWLGWRVLEGRRPGEAEGA